MPAIEIWPPKAAAAGCTADVELVTTGTGSPLTDNPWSFGELTASGSWQQYRYVAHGSNDDNPFYGWRFLQYRVWLSADESWIDPDGYETTSHADKMHYVSDADATHELDGPPTPNVWDNLRFTDHSFTEFSVNRQLRNGQTVQSQSITKRIDRIVAEFFLSVPRADIICKRDGVIAHGSDGLPMWCRSTSKYFPFPAS